MGRFALLQLRNSLCAQIEKNPYLNPTIYNGLKPYMKSKLQEIILGFRKDFSLLNTESFGNFFGIRIEMRLHRGHCSLAAAKVGICVKMHSYE